MIIIMFLSRQNVYYYFKENAIMDSDQKNGLMILGILMCLVGLAVAVALPISYISSASVRNPLNGRYQTVTTTVTGYGHPAGYAVASVGFMFLLAGGLSRIDEITKSTSEMLTCGKCGAFGTEHCVLKVQSSNALVCEKFDV